MSNVGRPKEYDHSVVLNAAMDAFWVNGYEATSIANLVTATGLHKGSLYKAFGNKHALFCAALEHYFDTVYQLKRDNLEQAPTPATGLIQSCRGMLFMGNADNEPAKGCMAVNTLVELAPHDPEVKRIIANHFMKTSAMITKTLVAGVNAGEIELSLPPELATTMLIAFLSGLASITKGPVSRDQADALLIQQFKLLGFKSSFFKDI